MTEVASQYQSHNAPLNLYWVIDMNIGKMREGCMLMIISNIGRGAEQNMQEPAGTVRRLDASIQPALAGKPQKQAPASEM